jgi:3-hydroxyacyl-[acyl-carrier-protein] dehydratase
MVTPLPHRCPFVLVDTIVDHVPGQHASARRQVSSADPLLRDARELSEIFLLEAMAQCAGIASVSEPAASGMLVAVDHFQVHSPVKAGDSLLIEARVVKKMGAMVKASAAIRVGEELRAECELVLRLAEAADESP